MDDRGHGPQNFTYAGKITELAGGYQYCCAAAALFYCDDDHKLGLRIEAGPTLMREFATGIEFGRDCEGLLFYKNRKDFNSTQEFTYTIYYNFEEPTAIWVEIAPYYEDDVANPTMAFITKDTNGVATDILAAGTVKGKWQEVQASFSPATLNKLSDNEPVTLMIPSIGKEVTFDDLNCTDAIDTPGTFYFKKDTKLTGSATDKTTVVDYNSDRIVFYPSQDKKNYVALFFPIEALPNTFNNQGQGKDDDTYATWMDLDPITDTPIPYPGNILQTI